MANDMDELIEIFKKTYDRYPEDHPDKQTTGDYINFLEREKIRLDLLKKLSLSTEGKLEFTSHVLDVSLTKTNEDLKSKGMECFMSCLINMKKDPKTYAQAKVFFISNITRLFGKITTEIIEGLEEGIQ